MCSDQFNPTVDVIKDSKVRSNEKYKNGGRKNFPFFTYSGKES